MATYGYGGGYTTTNYGAQGGADGGGFVSGSQSGSQDTPGGSKAYGKDTVRPVTIKQVIEAVIPHPSAEPKIDGVEIMQLSVIGQVLQVSSQTTNITFKIDDGTGVMEVKKWINDDVPESAKVEPKEGEYIHVWGRLKDFNGKRHIGAHIIRPITDFNEVNYHLLEATAVHLFFTRGPPETANQGGVKSEGMFVDNDGAGGMNGAMNGGRTLPAKLSATSRKVYSLLNDSPQNNEGLHVQNISSQLGLPISDVFKAGDELLQDGLIYTTVDDETWAVLEY